MKKSQIKTLENQIVQFLNNNPNRLYKRRELARKLNVAHRDYPAFKELVRELGQTGRIRRHKGNRFGKFSKPDEITGILHVKTAGYGFLIRDDEKEDVFISQRNMGSALHRDRVRVVLWARTKGRLPEGKVVEVLDRGRESIVGTLKKAKAYYYVLPDELKLNKDIHINRSGMAKAKPGQKVIVEILNWGDERRMPEGKVIQVLGWPDDPGVDISSVAAGFNLPLEFPGSVLKEAESVNDVLSEQIILYRKDLRDKLIFTIDPETAQDHDDAVSYEILPNGNSLLGVHIADVSHFVISGSAMDREALRRGTSVYLVDRVIPMLPERISNQICSLKPNQDRLAFSALMELTPDGELVDYEFAETIIRSRYKLSYQDVHQILLDRKQGRKSRSKQDKNLVDLLMRMADLSCRLKERWQKDGSINFDIPEAEVLLKDGRTAELKVKERYESHEIIESFMLLANRTVAGHIQFLREKTGAKLPFIYRIHERPRKEKLEEFSRFVRALGYDFHVSKKVRPRAFQDLLKHFQGTPQEIIVETIALRSMMKAVYTTSDIGHFGLAFPSYTHFTSPIRRYPDLMVHRLLKAYLKEDGKEVGALMKLSKMCDLVTEKEIKAQEAERESIRAKQVEYMERHIGDRFNGVISSVTSFGIFVEIPEFLVEGLILMKDLKDDYYTYDEKKYSLIGQNLGKVYRLGDPIQIIVARVWHQMRKIDFIPAG